MISLVKPYARARMKALGYQEHFDGFNYENVPANLFDRAFHVELGNVRGAGNNQDVQTCLVPFTVRLFLQGGKDVKARIDDAAGILDVLVYEFLRPDNRLTQGTIKTIEFTGAAVEAVHSTNDNSLIIRTEWTALVMIGTR